MTHLLDTHTFLWYADGSPRLGAAAAAALANPSNRPALSMASVWEIAIKSGLGKLTLSQPYDVLIEGVVRDYAIHILPITVEDCIAYQSLPLPANGHRDPFDRMIVVHALRHGLTLLSGDHKLDAYGVSRVW